MTIASAIGRPLTAEQVAAYFAGNSTPARRMQTAELLQTLAALGQAREADDSLWNPE